MFLVGGPFLTSWGTTTEFLTLILGVSLFLAVLTNRDWFPIILVTIMIRGPSTKGSRAVVEVINTLTALVQSSSRRTSKHTSIREGRGLCRVYDHKQ